MKRLGIAISAVMLAIGLLAVTPAIAGAPSIALLAAKKANGPYSEFVRVDIQKGKSKTLYLFGSNTGTALQTLHLGDDFSDFPSSDYQVRWYRGLKPKPTREITNQVQSEGGYVYNAPRRSARTFSITIKRKQGDAACVVGELEPTPAGDTGFAFISVNGSPCLV